MPSTTHNSDIERIAPIIAARFNLNVSAVTATINLLDSGATIPFIARYRKEATSGLSDILITQIKEEVDNARELDKRREYILNVINSAGKLTDTLRNDIISATTADRLEDLYLPFKPRRRTRATMAREAGLEPLAEIILTSRSDNPKLLAAQFVKGEIADVQAALSGACDIIAERVSENATIRDHVRYRMKRTVSVTASIVKGKGEQASNFDNYKDFSRPLSRVTSHQYLALCRGENEGLLKLSFSYDDDNITRYLCERTTRHIRSMACRQLIETASTDAYKRLIRPSIETEIRSAKKQEADTAAIDIFASSAQQLLMTPPLGARSIMAIDPGYRTGCKVVCLNVAGMLVEHTVIYPTPPHNDTDNAAATIKRLISKYHCQAIAVGNGTAGRETEQFIRNLDLGNDISIHLVNENGASIYSASEIARREFPNHDVTVRGAVSIGRRLIDPLAEMVKIDPKSIGVGQYQHDVDQKRLKTRLTDVVSSCVNAVGVDVNTASPELLTYVAGVGESLAHAIIATRASLGKFTSRRELLNVPRLGAKAFEQCAGFLRINDGSNPLDKTAVHPESYPIVTKMAKDLGVTVAQLIGDSKLIKQIDINNYVTNTIGLPTLNDIIAELLKPGRDPRCSTQANIFNPSVHTIDDISIGMELDGIVSNITSFGVFVDIGIKHSGLVHISQLADHYVSSPCDVVSIGQQVKVHIIDIDKKRNRIALSMKSK